MNPYDERKSAPNYWLSALLIDDGAMCQQLRSETEALYIPEQGKTCPTEILKAISSINAEGRPIWKPMHMQPMYRMHEFVTTEGSGRAKTNAYIAGGMLSKVDGKFTIQSGALEYENTQYSVLKIVADNIEGGLQTIQGRMKRYEKNI